MAAATRKNQERIIANEKKILRNQVRLVRILDNQNSILRDLQAMLKNQKKILANQSRILAKETSAVLPRVYDEVHGAGVDAPTRDLFTQYPPSRRREVVVPRYAIVLGGLPEGRHPTPTL
jgi:hypothetical protein